MSAIRFTGLAALRAALTAGTLPAELISAPARFATEEGGAVWIEPSGAVPRSAQTLLGKLGARVHPSAEVAELESIECWAQMLPLDRRPARGPAWFHLSDAQALPRLLAELRRLGGDDSEWGLLSEGGAWLRVASPPAALLFRAELDPAMRHFVEQSPGVWVAGGWQHPMPRPWTPPPGVLSFLEPDRRWIARPDPLVAHGSRTIALPGGTATAETAPPPIDVAPRFVVERNPGPAEMWVVDDDAKLRAWLAQADDRLVAKLLVAPVSMAGRPAFVLLARPGRGGVPVMVLDVPAYRSYRQLPNLFIPVNRRLMPPLRRDLARKFYAPDGDRLIWLDESMTASSIAFAKFQPLPQWVRYTPPTVDAWPSVEAEPLARLEPFTVKDRAAPKLRPVTSAPATAAEPTPAPPAPPAAGPDVWKTLVSWVRGAWTVAQVPAAPIEPIADLLVVGDASVEAIERRMLRDIETSPALVTPERWAELARGLHTAGRSAEACVVWPIALWSAETWPRDWTDAWLEAATKGRGLRLTGEPTADYVRAVAAFVVHTAQAGQPPGEWLGTVRQWITRHGDWLGVRAAWLAHRALARLGGGDPLGLARARDQVFRRLYDSDLTPELDIPTCLITADPIDASRRRTAGEWLPGSWPMVLRWLGARPTSTETAGVRLDRFGLARERSATPIIAEGLWDIGLARVGGTNPGRPRPTLRNPSDVVGWVLDAIDVRVREARRGLSPRGGWPAEMLSRRNALAPMDRYGVDKVREKLRLLEPAGAVDAYAVYQGLPEPALASVVDAGEFQDQWSAVRAEPTEPVLRIALAVAPRFGADATREVIEVALRHTEAGGRTRANIDLLIAAWEAGRSARIDAVLGDLERATLAVLKRRTGEKRRIGMLLANAGAALARAGRGDRLAGLDAAARVLLRGQTEIEPGDELAFAEFAAIIDDRTRARAVTERHRAAIHAGEADLETTLAYIRAVGRFTSDATFRAMSELFQAMPAPGILATTDTWYNLAALRIVDAVVAVAVGEATPGPVLEQWMHQEQLRIREHVRRDLAAEGLS